MREDEIARTVARTTAALMDEGHGYEDALIVACASLPPSALIGAAARRTERLIELTIEEIVANDLAPRVPLAYDDYLLATLELCEGDDDDPAYRRLVMLARFEDESDDGQPFVVRGGVVERRPS